MLIKNLLRSWSELQSKVAIFENEDVFGIKTKNSSIEFVQLPCRDTNMQWLNSQKIKLLTLLIDIIEENKLNYEINSYLWGEDADELKREYKVHLSKMRKNFLFHASNDLINSCLWVYAESLALQRNIIAGQWQHFKSTTPICNVTAIASWIEKINFEATKFYSSSFKLEESPEQDIQLVKVGDKHYYLADKDYGDRVFYHYDGDKQWAREKSNFLGLVGPEHSESEGLLRFREIFN